MPRQIKDRVISLIDRLAMLVAMAITLILPLGFSGLAYRNLVDRVDTQAHVKAAAITDLVSGNPGLWVYEIQRMEHLLLRYPVPISTSPIDGEAASAYNANGVLLASVGNPPDERLMRRSHPIYDSGRVVGRVEVVHSLRGLIVGTALVAMLGLLLGSALYGVFRTWPMRELRRMGVALDAEQAALRTSEERYRTLIEWSPEAMVVYRGHKVLYVNPAGIKLFGNSSAQEMTGKTILDFIHPDSHQMALARVKSIAESSINPPMAEMKFLKLDGTVMDAEVQSTSIMFDGKPAICSDIRDITGRKQAEAARHQSDQRFRDLVDSTDGIVWEADAATFVFSFVSKNAVRLLGYPMVDWLQPGFWPSHIHPEDRDQAVQYCVACTGRFEDHEFEYRFIAADGRVVWLRDIVKVVEENGSPRWLRGLMLDTTERKQAEAVNVAIIDASMDAIISVDESERIVVFSAAAEKLFRLSAAEAIGQRIDRFIPARFRDGHHVHLRRLVQGGAANRAMGQLAQLSALRPDGTEFPIEASISHVVSGSGHLLTVTMRDISERKQAEAVHASLEARLRESQKMEAIGTLAGGIAHDFNNIIATILGNAELARQDMNANPQALESLEEIRKAGSRARDLVQQILSFSRRQPTERKLTALTPVIEESMRLLRATLPARITLEVHCDVETPPAMADANQIQQILINLVTNAMQAMRDEPGRIGIRLDTVMLDAALAEAHPALGAMHARHPGRTLRFAVTDNGPGMDAATLERIFEPFFTTKPVDEGTGLGLAVVHGIVETHEGEIEVASQPGKGTTFTIYLPVAAAANAPEPDERTAATAAPSRAAGGRHILYLDDDESLVFLVTRLLERRGFRISGFIDQRKALDALSADPAGFDLVVTDYNMPGMSGLDVARAVRSIRSDLAVAVASGFIDETLRAQADGAGVRELIFKASAVEVLCEAFARLAQTVGEKAKDE